MASVACGLASKVSPAWRRCNSTAKGNCSLPAGVTGAPAWTQMAPGDCALQYLDRADKGFSASPQLNGNRNSSGPRLPYWTGTHPCWARPPVAEPFSGKET